MSQSNPVDFLKGRLQVASIVESPAKEQHLPGTALSLSGGGYRAMLFHLGALWRLNEFGLLSTLARISSVSGGSVTAGVLATKWASLDFKNSAVAQNFREQIVPPIMDMASRTIDLPSIATGIFFPDGAAGRIASAYRRHLFGRATLQDLPDKPRFVFNATNVQSTVLWRFSKPYMRDYRVGEVKNPKVEIAIAVAASSAFPPFLSPLTLNLSDKDFGSGTGKDLQQVPYTTKVFLTDGGVYDNVGLETVKEFKTNLVSDGGAKVKAEGRPLRNWLCHVVRVLEIIDNQVDNLRKRVLIEAFKEGIRDGAYWSIRSHMKDFGTAGALSCPEEKTVALANLPTRLKAIDPVTQKRLINWGYAICDAGIRKHFDTSFAAPQDFPYPGVGVG